MRMIESVNGELIFISEIMQSICLEHEVIINDTDSYILCNVENKEIKVFVTKSKLTQHELDYWMPEGIDGFYQLRIKVPGQSSRFHVFDMRRIGIEYYINAIQDDMNYKIPKNKLRQLSLF